MGPMVGLADLILNIEILKLVPITGDPSMLIYGEGRFLDPNDLNVFGVTQSG